MSRSSARPAEAIAAPTANRGASGDLPLEAVDFDVLDGLMSFHLRAVTLALSRDLDKRLGGLAVARGTGKISCLLLVGANPGIRASTLAKLTLRDRAAATRLVDGLAEAGLVERRPEIGEGRAQALHLTGAGAALSAQVRQIICEQSLSFFQDLEPEEEALMRSLLRRVYRRVAGLAA